MRFRTLKKGQSTARKYPEKAGHYLTITLRERQKQHKLRHPNDKNIPNPEKGIYYRKKRKGGKK